MANPPRKASGSNKRKEMATKPTSPQSKKRVSVGARTSMKGKTATKSPAKRSRAGTRSTHNISTVETQSTHVDPVLETSLQAVPSIGTSGIPCHQLSRFVQGDGTSCTGEGSSGT